MPWFSCDAVRRPQRVCALHRLDEGTAACEFSVEFDPTVRLRTAASTPRWRSRVGLIHRERGDRDPHELPRSKHLLPLLGLALDFDTAIFLAQARYPPHAALVSRTPCAVHPSVKQTENHVDNPAPLDARCHHRRVAPGEKSLGCFFIFGGWCSA